MAHTALNDEEIREYFDTPGRVIIVVRLTIEIIFVFTEELNQKVKTLADYIRHAKHFVVYTGAGISTSAGINDFRGPNGVWTARARGVSPARTSVRNPVPTLTHMAYVELMRTNYLKFLVSQNCDGLHLKSGISTDKIAELHGNSNCEACAKCGKVYYRQEKNHEYERRTRLTGRYCTTPNCEGRLRCTTVAFSQEMPDICLNKATEESKKCDLSLCMGTSMRVTPACELPAMKCKSRKKKMVIVSKRSTLSHSFSYLL